MKRIRKIGFAVLMAMALTAVSGAASASASTGFSADQYPAKVSGKETGEQTMLGFNFATVGCPNSALTAQVNGPSGKLTAGVSGMSCNFFASKTPVQMNGCSLIFHPGAKTGEGTFNGTFEIGPAGCGPITIAFVSIPCTITIGPQSGLKATYQNQGAGSEGTVAIAIDATGIKYTESGSQCAKKGTSTNGTWKGSWSAGAQNSVGKQVGLRVADLGVGLYLAGKGGEGDPPRFEAESYPMTISGTQGSLTFSAAQGSVVVKCPSVLYGGSLNSSATSLSLEAQYSGCMEGAWTKAPVVMNSCEYVIEDLSFFSPYYDALLGVACDEEGDAIEIQSPFCTYMIAPQSHRESILPFNQGTGSDRSVLVALDAEVEYTEVETPFEGCSYPGKVQTGGYLTGGVTLEGFVDGYVG